MSIIYEALKKVEKSIYKDRAFEVNKERKPQPKYKIYALYLLGICLTLFASNAFFRFLAKPKKPSSAALAPAPNDQQPPPKEEPVLESKQPTPPETTASISAETKKESPSFTLNGIFFSENEGFALINNQIVKKGDEIDGALVKQITLRGVELQAKGEVIKLSTNSR